MKKVSEIAKIYKIPSEGEKEIFHTVSISYFVGIGLGLVIGVFGTLAILWS